MVNLWKASHGKLAFGLSLLLFFVIAVPGVAYADYQVYDGTSGAYHVTVWARPNPVSVGKVHLLIRLGRQANISQEYPVRGAKVSVRFKQLTGPGTEPGSQIDTYHQVLPADESEPGNYEMEDSLLSEGRYQVLITLDSGAGKNETNFEFTAQPQPDDRFVSLILLALFPLGLLTLVYLYVSQGRKGSKPLVETKVKSDQSAN